MSDVRSLDDLTGKTRMLMRSTAFAGYATGLLALYEVQLRTLPSAVLPRLRAFHKSRISRDGLALLGADWVVDGRPPSHGRASLVVSNHRSALDIPLLLSQFDASILSRADIADWPVLGHLAKHGGTIFVDRKDRSSGVRALKQIQTTLKRGDTVCLFPEGTTFAGDEVRPFSPGAFACARSLGVDVVPVGIAYEQGCEWTERSFSAHLGKVASRRGTRVHVVIGAPVPAVGKSDAIAERMRDEVQALVHIARARLEER